MPGPWTTPNARCTSKWLLKTDLVPGPQCSQDCCKGQIMSNPCRIFAAKCHVHTQTHQVTKYKHTKLLLWDLVLRIFFVEMGLRNVENAQERRWKLYKPIQDNTSTQVTSSCQIGSKWHKRERPKTKFSAICSSSAWKISNKHCNVLGMDPIYRIWVGPCMNRVISTLCNLPLLHAVNISVYFNQAFCPTQHLKQQKTSLQKSIRILCISPWRPPWNERIAEASKLKNNTTALLPATFGRFVPILRNCWVLHWCYIGSFMVHRKEIRRIECQNIVQFQFAFSTLSISFLFTPGWLIVLSACVNSDGLFWSHSYHEPSPFTCFGVSWAQNYLVPTTIASWATRILVL